MILTIRKYFTVENFPNYDVSVLFIQHTTMLQLTSTLNLSVNLTCLVLDGGWKIQLALLSLHCTLA